MGAKVKIFQSKSIDNLESQVNDFLAGIDPLTVKNITINSGWNYFYAAVLY